MHKIITTTSFCKRVYCKSTFFFPHSFYNAARSHFPTSLHLRSCIFAFVTSGAALSIPLFLPLHHTPYTAIKKSSSSVFLPSPSRPKMAQFPKGQVSQVPR